MIEKTIDLKLLAEYENKIQKAWLSVQEKIEKAVFKANRKKEEIKVLAVSKTQSIEAIQAAINLGFTLFGENRVQEVLEKFPYLFEKNPHIALHFIGNLQRNKVKAILPFVQSIQSLDRMVLAKEIVKESQKIEAENDKIRNWDLLLEVHTAEDSKNGFKKKDEIWACIDYLLEEAEKNNWAKLQVQGFMTMAPFTNDEKKIRTSFQSLKKIQEEAKKRYLNLSFPVLSMGMTNDYEIAIEEGATMLRIGSALF